MNIYEALESVQFEKREYFKWKHDIRYQQERGQKSEERFLAYVQRRTLNSFYQWEKTPEYKHLLMLLLEWRSTQDFEQIYEVVSKKAKDGDDKAVKLFLSLQKEINTNAKAVKALFENVDDEKEEEDDLEV
ncbi:hypothetical protein [Halobacillus amylolyticus]|uniref:Uncharacterized protein n=1 Tax=Halobacillus amylolyticus TaxID=2932259 RepID=A0ABY4HBH0_9BACI|nr:hypothetical protein [Halobacillus amylolyticus]UOR12186.1 hypothetical protein MUO15_01210 [Halobacillus amylolyticus]